MASTSLFTSTPSTNKPGGFVMRKVTSATSVAAPSKVPGLTDEQNKKRDTVLQLIRSLLNSAQGDLTLNQLQNDYYQMVEEEIPYRELHHATLASIVQSAPELLQLVNRSGTLYVRTVPSAKDHIASLVTGQRKVAKKAPRQMKTTGGSTAMMHQPASNTSRPLLPNPSMHANSYDQFSKLLNPNHNQGKREFGKGFRSVQQQRQPLPVVNPANVNVNPPHRVPIPQRQSLAQLMQASGSIKVPNESSGISGCTNKVPLIQKAPSVQPLLPPPPPQQQKQQQQHLLKSPPRLQIAQGSYTNNNINKKNFYVSNNIQIPRAQRSTTQNFPPYCQVPPRFTKGKMNNGPKQQLEQLAKDMGYKNLVFRSIPYDKSWLATLEVNGNRYSSYPDERRSAEEAESVVAEKALKELLAVKQAAESLPVTKDYGTCIARVKQLVSGQVHGMWFSHLRERYQEQHKENLPHEFCEEASAMNDSDIVFTRHENLWILYEKQDYKGDDVEHKHSSGLQEHHEPLSLPVPLHSPPQEPYVSTRQQPQSLPPLQHAEAAVPSLQQHQSHRQVVPSLSAVTTSATQTPHLQSQTTVTQPQSQVQLQPAVSPSPPQQLSTAASFSLSLTLPQTPSAIHSPLLDPLPDANLTNASEDSGFSSGTSAAVPAPPPTASAEPHLIVGSNNFQCDAVQNAFDSLALDGSPQPPILKLPEEDNWDIYVSHVTDDNKICFRLLGDSYNDAYEELMTEMELYYYGKKNCISPDTVQLGRYYLLHHDETWYRVLITRVTEGAVAALFVDHGDTEEVERDNIYELLPKFLKLPCQYVQASLTNLEGFRCEALSTELQTGVMGQSLVAQVTARHPQVQVVLIDTSADEDVNINDKLLELLPNSFTKPQLPQVGGIAEVFLTCVRDDGRLFVTIESETYTMLEHMLTAAKGNSEELAGETEIDLTKLYLARFASGNLHRVRPTSSRGSLDKALLECIDWGVPLTKAVSLHALTPPLSLVPPQALECVLANVPPSTPAGLKWTRRATNRLEELQPQTGPILLKTVGNQSSGVAEVLLFKRLQPRNELISINETLAMDTDLFTSTECNNNESSSSNTDSTSTCFSPCKTGEQLLTPLLKPSELPPIGSMLDVYVTYAANPANLAVQWCAQYSALEQLRRDMQSHYSAEESARRDGLAGPEAVTEGGSYAALHTDGYWYRVRVSSIMRGADMICGVFVDFGDCFVSTSSKMRRLLPVFADLPCQSIRAALAGVSPINGDWMPEDTCRFRDLVEDREFVSYVMGFLLDTDLVHNQPSQEQHVTPVSLPGQATAANNTRVLLKLVDTSAKDKDVYIDQLMVSEGRAKAVPTPLKNGGSAA